MNITGHVFVPTMKFCLLGICEKSLKYRSALNIMLLIVKYNIFKCKYAQCELSVVHLARMFRNRIVLYNNAGKMDIYAPLLQMFPHV